MTHNVTRYATEETRNNERMVSAFLEKAWNVEILDRGHYDPIDWDIIEDGEQIGVIELKSYNRYASKDPVTICNVRKYIALRDWNLETDMPAIYMVNFLDEIRYIDVRNINPSHPVMGGQKGGPRSTDWEPVYQILVSSMKLLAKKGKQNG
jgi:hypothetical protein